MSYKCNFFTPSSLIVTITPTSTELAGPQHISSLTAEELAVVATISQCLARLQNGKFVDYNFQPSSFENPNEVVKMEWLESGNLKLHGKASKLWNLVETTEDALRCRAIFCCERKLITSLPKKRDAKYSKPWKL